MSMWKIAGDLIQGYSLKIAAGVTAIIVANDVYDFLKHAFDPVSKALGPLSGQ
jgi:hypothetical protein